MGGPDYPTHGVEALIGRRVTRSCDRERGQSARLGLLRVREHEADRLCVIEAHRLVVGIILRLARNVRLAQRIAPGLQAEDERLRVLAGVIAVTEDLAP